MSSGAIVFFILGAMVLWGGLATTLTLAIVKEKKEKSLAIFK